MHEQIFISIDADNGHIKMGENHRIMEKLSFTIDNWLTKHDAIEVQFSYLCRPFRHSAQNIFVKVLLTWNMLAMWTQQSSCNVFEQLEDIPAQRKCSLKSLSNIENLVLNRLINKQFMSLNLNEKCSYFFHWPTSLEILINFRHFIH